MPPVPSHSTSIPRPTRRALLGGMTLLSVAPVLVACGESDPATGDAAAGGGASAGAERGAFPVSIKHKFGSTRITSAPRRVVVVGYVEQDALLALGVVPVADTKWFGEARGQIFPWANDALGDATRPTVLTSTDGIEVEKVAALAPDLIIGRYAGITQKEYSLLSKIAPTVAQSGDYVDYGEPWTSSTTAVAQAIGRPAAGERLIARVSATIDGYRSDNPGFAGKTAVVVTPYEGLFVYGPEDPRGRILDQLGFTFPEQLLDPSAKAFGWSLSAERTADLADVDAVVWLGDEAAIDKGTGGLWARTKAAEQGRGIFIAEDNGDAFYVGQSMVTPLSIPYVLQRYVPQLVAAVDGKPATSIPSA